jgi:hypothetical protein
MTHNRGASELAVRQLIGIRVQKDVLDQRYERRMMKVNWELNKKMLVVQSVLREAQVAVSEKQLSGSAFGIANAN